MQKPPIIDAEIIEEESDARAVRRGVGREVAESAAGVVDAAANILAFLDPEGGEKLRERARTVRDFGEAATQTVDLAKATAVRVQGAVLQVETSVHKFKDAYQKLDKMMSIPRSGTLRRR